jgi:hypothetical protein
MSSVASGIPFVGVVVSLVTYARVLRKGRHAWDRYKACKHMLKNRTIHTNEMKGVLKFAVGKSKRKMRVVGVTAGTAAVGSLSSTILGTTAIVGAANAWNPVGWTLLGLSAVGGTGVVVYKVYRRVTRRKRHVARAIDDGPINATDMARRLLSIARDNDHGDRKLARKMLGLFGVDEDDIDSRAIDSAVEQMINRHLKHV